MATADGFENNLPVEFKTIDGKTYFDTENEANVKAAIRIQGEARQGKNGMTLQEAKQVTFGLLYGGMKIAAPGEAFQSIDRLHRIPPYEPPPLITDPEALEEIRKEAERTRAYKALDFVQKYGFPGDRKTFKESVASARETLRRQTIAQIIGSVILHKMERIVKP